MEDSDIDHVVPTRATEADTVSDTEGWKCNVTMAGRPVEVSNLTAENRFVEDSYLTYDSDVARGATGVWPKSQADKGEISEEHP
eukprot:1239119-Karenia_brevis.AAC.1